MKHVLYLTYDGLTDPLGQSQILPYLQGLCEKAYSFTIISFEKTGNKNLQPVIEKQLMAAKIAWFPLSYTKRPPILSTLRDLYRLNRLSFQLHKKTPFNLIHCRSYITSLVGLRMKEKVQTKFIFDMRGFWADERIDGSIWTLKNPLFRFIYSYFKKKEKDFLSKSDYAISLTLAGKKIIENSIVPGQSSPIQVIPCCVDNHHFSPGMDTKNLIKSLQIEPDRFVLGYVGSIGTWYMLSEMVDFFAVLTQKKKNALFLFVTKEDPIYIQNQFKNKGIAADKLKIVSSNRMDVPKYIAIMDWSIFFIKPVFSKQASSPTKQGEIMSMGIPVVCNKGIGDTDEIVNKYKSGVSVMEFSNEHYENVVEDLFSFRHDPEQIRKGSIDYFGLEKGINAYHHVYESCFSDS